MDKYVTDNPQSNMETALNLFYIKDGETWVRGVGIKGEDETLCNFIRLIGDEHPMLDFDDSTDEALSENMYELLADGISTDEGIVALLYQAAWAFSVLREKVKQYEEIGLSAEEVKNAAAFKQYFDALYGQGLMVANWHQNGELEPLDSFIESAVEVNNG